MNEKKQIEIFNKIRATVLAEYYCDEQKSISFVFNFLGNKDAMFSLTVYRYLFSNIEEVSVFEADSLENIYKLVKNHYGYEETL